MIRYLLLIALFMQGVTASRAQFDYSAVEKIGELAKSDSALYESIATRFAEGDTLTMEELRLLYYGSAFRPGFDPYQEERIIDAADALARRDRPYDAMYLLDNFLRRNPASLLALLDKAYLSWVINDSANTEKNYFRYFQLLAVPLSSGDGLSPDTAFLLRSVQDEELVMNKLGKVLLSQTLLNHAGRAYHQATSALENDIEKRQDFYFLIELPLKMGKQKTIDKPANGH